MGIFYLVHDKLGRETRVGDRLRERGIQVTFCNHGAGDKLPEDVSGYEAVIVGGGAHSANDGERYPYVAREIQWICRVVERETPFLGICLGGQMLANAFGGKVGEHPARVVECGWHDIAPTAAGRDFLGDLTHVYQFHREGFEPPPGSVPLARSSSYPHQAFRIGAKAYGIQFHPDCRTDMMPLWFEGSETKTRPGAQKLSEHLDGAEKYDPGLVRWLDRFLDGWLR